MLSIGGRRTAGTRLLRAGAAVLVAVWVGGCAIFGGGKDQPEPAGPQGITFTLTGADLLNSCGEGVGNALAVRVYQLSGDARISMSTLGSLWKDENSELGKELVDKSELILEPGDQVPVSIELKPGTQVIAVVGNYCKSQGDCWRWTRPVAEVPAKVSLVFDEYCIEQAGP